MYVTPRPDVNEDPLYAVRLGGGVTSGLEIHLMLAP